MKKSGFLFLPIIALSFSACVSGGASRETPPSWITSAPGDSAGYYTGISGSNTGRESDDRDLAYGKALGNLAGSIYTEVRASSEITESEDAGGYRSSYENNIETSVSSNLAQVETVDSYYSEDLGYWVYLRISKEVWERLAEERAQEMRELADDLFNDIFPDSLTELKVIGRAMEAFSRLYSGEPIKTTLFGQSGSIDTILTLRAEKLLGEMDLEWDSLPPVITGGKPASLSGRVRNSGEKGSPLYENPGAVTLVLRNGSGSEIRRFQTERDGRFDLEFTDKETLGPADYTLAMESPYGGASLSDIVGYRLPAARQNCIVKAYVLPVKVESSWPGGDISGRTLTFLKDLETLDVAPWTGDGDSSYLLARLSFRQAPPNDYGMIISYATLFLSHVTEDGEVALWTSKEYKDGGLNEDQANRRASEKLFAESEGREELRRILAGL